MQNTKISKNGKNSLPPNQPLQMIFKEALHIETETSNRHQDCMKVQKSP